MTSERAYPLDVWDPAAWGHEIDRAPFARKICDADLVFYRRQDGSVRDKRERLCTCVARVHGASITLDTADR